MPMILKNRIRIAAKCELARRDFFQYCNVKAPSFYKKDRSFLKNFCHGLQDFYESDDEVLVVNMPPRHGKSRTVGCFVGWAWKNQKMTGHNKPCPFRINTILKRLMKLMCSGWQSNVEMMVMEGNYLTSPTELRLLTL